MVLPGNGGGSTPSKKKSAAQLALEGKLGNDLVENSSWSNVARFLGGLGKGGASPSGRLSKAPAAKTTRSRGNAKALNTQPTHAANRAQTTKAPAYLTSRTGKVTTAPKAAARPAAVARPGKGADPGKAKKAVVAKPKNVTTNAAPANTPMSTTGSSGGSKATPKAAAPATPTKASTTKGDTSKATSTTGKSALEKYIDEAQKLLGPGTDYSGLKKTLTADTGTADTQIAAMYEALNRGVIASGQRIQQGYTESEQAQKEAAADATKTIQGSYASSADQVTERLKALGIQDAASTLQAQGSDAQADQARAVSGVAARMADAVGTTAARGATARETNERLGTSGQFAALDQRSALQQQLVDGRSKLDTQQSTENAGRREKALNYAQTQVNADASAAQAAQDFALKVKEAAFNQSYKSGMLGVAQSKASSDASYKQGQLAIGNTKATTDAKYKAGVLNQNAQNEAGRNTRAQDKMALATQQYKASVQKLKDSNLNSLRNRQNAARNAAVSAGISGDKINEYVSKVK